MQITVFFHSYTQEATQLRHSKMYGYPPLSIQDDDLDHKSSLQVPLQFAKSSHISGETLHAPGERYIFHLKKLKPR